MKRQTWLRHRIPNNTRAPLAAYTCLILGQISRHGGIMRCGRNDSFNHGEGIRRKSLLLSGYLRPLARSLCHYFDLMPARLTASPHRTASELMESETPAASAGGAVSRCAPGRIARFATSRPREWER